MAKRGYKLQEFVAHSTNVNCVSIGKKACRLFITGGDDHKVNLWSIGKPTSLMSLCGHTSPVESVTFDTAEVLVLAGASAGAIKLWDLEEAKLVRTLTGHRSNCTAVEFHPFGEFFASGSNDTNLRIWDIRKKGCIHTYKGHTRGISTIRFTPDGRWIVSGGSDNVVKVWDLTAGKLLHDFKFHEGPIRSIDFHPLEFLLATGSADRTVKLWDLETFKLIGSVKPEATGVRTIAFHPDGRTLFCGLDDSLKVYSWEPVVCHDAVDMGWSTLADLCIHEGKLLGCSYYRNTVGVWVADISLIEPYRTTVVPEKSDCIEEKFNISRSRFDKVGSGTRSASSLRSRSPDYETKEIKNIYVDSTSESPVASQRHDLLGSPKNAPTLDPKEMSNTKLEKQNPSVDVDANPSGKAFNKLLALPTVVPRESPLEKDSATETITFSKTKLGMLLRPAHARRPSNSKNDVEKRSVAFESGTLSSAASRKESATYLNSQEQILSEDEASKSREGKSSSIKSATEKFETVQPETPSNMEKYEESSNGGKGVTSVKIVNGVAIVAGRTRSLVERFEKRERSGNEDQAINITYSVLETNRTLPSLATNVSPHVPSETERTSTIATNMTPCVIPETERTGGIESNMTPPSITGKGRTITATNFSSCVIPEPDGTFPTATNVTPHVLPETERGPTVAINMTSRIIPEMDMTPSVSSYRTPPVIHRKDRNITAASNITTTCIIPETDKAYSRAANVIPRIMCGADRTAKLKEEPQTSGRDSLSAYCIDVTEDLMLTHDIFSSTLKSRLKKLQVIRLYWGRNDIKGAINAMRSLPDHSVQADVVSVLIEKMEILTLDLFSCFLPVLVGLLDSKMERHANVSLEMLLKLVAVFGPVIRATISAPPAVGVDLHQEQRLECCNQCFIQLQKIQKVLPVVIRKGGLLAKYARELNLVLQEP